MCGIAGILRRNLSAPPPSRDDLRAMVRQLGHRGPDCFGFYRDEDVGLGHARLAIIDLVSGDQPMTNENESLWLVFNGEIFNFVELRGELVRCGHQVRTHSDTEVILHAYEEWGTGCFERFNGQWAVAIWDKKRKTLCLSRDRVGVRPLYVSQQPDQLSFASEIKALFALPAVPREIDPHGMAQVFSYWCPIAPRTVFKGIEELVPGSYRIYRSGGLKEERRYWRPSFPARNSEQRLPSMAAAAEHLKEELVSAVRLRMTRADVPVGSYLSGGIDSSVIARLAREYAAGDFRTFSVRFADAEFDETPYQRMMAEALGSRHDELMVTRQDIAGVFPRVIYHAEQPVLRTAPAPMYMLSGLVRDSGYKTVLTGEGADEFLAGYDIFREAKVRAFWSRQPESSARPKLFDRLYPYLARSPRQAHEMAWAYWKVGLENAGHPGFSHERRWTTTSSLQRFFSRDVKSVLVAAPPEFLPVPLPDAFGQWDDLAQAQLLEIESIFQGYILSAQGDRMLMAHGVEGRFPFLDSEVMRYCIGLDPLHKLPGLREKAVLKYLAKDLIPEAILQRSKQPYRAPDAVCFVEPSAPEWVQEMLSPEQVTHAGLFEVSAVDKLVAKLKGIYSTAGSTATVGNIDNMALIGVLSAQLLHALFVERWDPPGSGLQMQENITVDLDGSSSGTSHNVL
jgi:asparagine synthase (glutamine-hydrolysing)